MPQERGIRDTLSLEYVFSMYRIAGSRGCFMKEENGFLYEGMQPF